MTRLSPSEFAGWRQSRPMFSGGASPQGSQPEGLPHEDLPCKVLRGRPMNGLEERFSRWLDGRKALGRIQRWVFEGIKLRIGPRCFYTPDFYVVDAKDRKILYEVKGQWKDDARVKLKTSCRIWPEFRFVAVQFFAGEWQFEEAQP